MQLSISCYLFFEMSTTAQHFRTFVRPHPLHSEASQRVGAKGEVYTEGKGNHVLGKLVQVLRADEAVYIEWLFLLAEPQTEANPRPLWSLWRNMDAIEHPEGKPGVPIVEWGSGKELWSNRRRDRDIMTRNAIEMLRHAGRVMNGKKSHGRPQKPREPEELRIMELEYVSKRNKSIDTVLVKIKARGIKHVTRSELYKRFGGRIVGKRNEKV